MSLDHSSPESAGNTGCPDALSKGMMPCSVKTSGKSPWKFGVRIALKLLLLFGGSLAIFLWRIRPPHDFWMRPQAVQAILFLVGVTIVLSLFRAWLHVREQRKLWFVSDGTLFLRGADGVEHQHPVEEISSLHYSKKGKDLKLLLRRSPRAHVINSVEAADAERFQSCVAKLAKSDACEENG